MFILILCIKKLYILLPMSQLFFTLLFILELVMNHEHGFHCEFCSKEIDTNFWFYHCDDCDLSFHLRCCDNLCYLNYSHIKFGGTIMDKLHHHSLTYVLNEKFRHCGECNSGIIGEPVLEFAPCKTIFCWFCWDRWLESV